MSTTKDKINFQNTWSCNKTTGRRSGNLQSIRRLLEHDTSGSVCPSCRISFDKGKRRKLIDTCGHERCYSCMFRNDQCPMCMNSSLKDVDCSNTQGYDTGIGGSTSTIVSPLGSPQPQLRSQVQRANELALDRYMQHNRQESISPEYHRYASIGKLPKASASSLAATNNNSNKYSLTGNTSALGTTAPGKARLKQHTVTADIHNNNGISHGHKNGTSSPLSITSSKIGHSNAAAHNTASTNNNGHQYNVANVAATSTYNYSEIHASAFATPQTRRRFS